MIDVNLFDFLWFLVISDHVCRHNFEKNNLFDLIFLNITRIHNSTDFVKFWEKSLEPFLRKVPKISFLSHFGPFFYGFSQNDGKWRKKSKIRLVHFFCLKCALLHEKFQKNCWSGFRDNPERTHARTNERTEAIL